MGLFRKRPGDDQRDEEEKQPQQEEEESEIVEEVVGFLRRQRWEVRDEPFQGFGSPPGKF